MKKFFMGTAILIAAQMAASVVSADSAPALIGAHQDWTVFRAEDPVECWAVTAPSRPSPPAAESGRGDVRLYLVPRGEGRAEISFSAGLPLDAGAGAKLTVKGKVFDLLAEGEGAWAQTEDQEAKIVALMRRAGVLRINAVSAAGAQIEDSFSMMGVSQALDQARASCD